MRRNRLLALWAALALLCLWGCGAEEAPGARRSVALITKSTDSEFFLAVFAGARAAATEYNLELTISGPETEEDYETQNKMIAQAVEDGAEVIVFSAIDYERNAASIDEAAKAGVGIVSIDSGVGSDQVSTYIGPCRWGLSTTTRAPPTARSGSGGRWTPWMRAAGPRSRR